MGRSLHVLSWSAVKTQQEAPGGGGRTAGPSPPFFSFIAAQFGLS